MKQPHFRLRLFKVFFLLLFIASCNKADYPFRSVELRNDEAIAKKFFVTNGSVTPEATKVINKLQRYPEQVVTLIKTKGFALWDKAIVWHTVKNSVSNTNGLNQVNNVNTETPSSICIPLVRDSSQQVTDMLLCYISPKDSISIVTVGAGNYKWYEENKKSTGVDGAQISLIMMRLDEKVFGHTDFSIKDKSLFSAYTKNNIGQIQFIKKYSLNINTNQSVSVTYNAEEAPPIEYCFTYSDNAKCTCPSSWAQCDMCPVCVSQLCISIPQPTPIKAGGGEEENPGPTDWPSGSGGGGGGGGGAQPCTPVSLPQPTSSTGSHPCPIPAPWEPVALNTLTQELHLNPIQVTWLAQHTDYLSLINNQLIEEGFLKKLKQLPK